MNALGILKTVTEAVVSVGAGAVVGNAIKASTPANAKRITKISIAIGGFALSSMAGDMVAKYMTRTIDETVDQFKTMKSATEYIVVQEDKE